MLSLRSSLDNLGQQLASLWTTSGQPGAAWLLGLDNLTNLFASRDIDVRAVSTHVYISLTGGSGCPGGSEQALTRVAAWTTSGQPDGLEGGRSVNGSSLGFARCGWQGRSFRPVAGGFLWLISGLHL